MPLPEASAVPYSSPPVLPVLGAFLPPVAFWLLEVYACALTAAITVFVMLWSGLHLLPLIQPHAKEWLRTQPVSDERKKGALVRMQPGA